MKRTNCAMRYYSTTYQYSSHKFTCLALHQNNRSIKVLAFGDLGCLGYVERSNIERLNHT
jgi:hypothetical protein